MVMLLKLMTISIPHHSTYDVILTSILIDIIFNNHYYKMENILVEMFFGIMLSILKTRMEEVSNKL